MVGSPVNGQPMIGHTEWNLIVLVLFIEFNLKANILAFLSGYKTPSFTFAFHSIDTKGMPERVPLCTSIKLNLRNVCWFHTLGTSPTHGVTNGSLPFGLLDLLRQDRMFHPFSKSIHILNSYCSLFMYKKTLKDALVSYMCKAKGHQREGRLVHNQWTIRI